MIFLQLATTVMASAVFIWMAAESRSVAALVMTGYFCWEVISDAIIGGPLPPLVTIGPFALYGWDLICLCLASITILKFVVCPIVNRYQSACLFLFALMLIGTIRGFAEFGVEAAGLEVRKFFYFLIGTLYFSVPGNAEKFGKDVFRIWLWASALISIVYILQYLIGGLEQFHQQVARLGVAEAFTGLRSFNALAAFFIAQAAIISLYLWIYKSGPKHWQLAGIILFMPVVTLLLHRTSLLALFVMLIMTCIIERRRSKFLAFLAVGYPMAAAFSFMVLSFLDLPIFQVLATATTEPFAATSTFSWRMNLWAGTIDSLLGANPLTFLVGQPFGFSSSSDQLAVKIISHTHNYYLYTALYLGVAGLIGLLVLYVRTLRTLLNTGRWVQDLDPAARLLGVLLVGHLVFYITYAGEPVQSILLGLAMMTAAQKNLGPGRQTSLRMGQPLASLSSA